MFVDISQVSKVAASIANPEKEIKTPEEIDLFRKT